MKTQVQHGSNGNTLICALCTIVIISLIGANVLVNCTRHYNITAKQLKAWKEALYAAEAGGDAGVGDTLLRKIDFKYDHFKGTYGDGDGNNISLLPVAYPQITRRIELIAVPKYYVFGGALRVVNAFDGPGTAGFIDSYNSKNPTNPNPSSPQVVNNDIPGPNATSYYGSNPSNSTFLADAHDA